MASLQPAVCYYYDLVCYYCVIAGYSYIIIVIYLIVHVLQAAQELQVGESWCHLSLRIVAKQDMNDRYFT